MLCIKLLKLQVHLMVDYVVIQVCLSTHLLGKRVYSTMQWAKVEQENTKKSLYRHEIHYDYQTIRHVVMEKENVLTNT